MKVNSKILLLILIACLTAPLASAQVYVGAGYIESLFLEVSTVDDAHGFNISIQKVQRLGSSRWRAEPGLQLGFLYSNIGRNFQPSYANTLSLTPAVSYDIIKARWITLTPYAGPFVNWITGMKAGDLLFKPEQYNAWFVGVEIGLGIYLSFSENFSVKLVPFSYQTGNKLYRQGTISVLFSW